MTRLRLRPASMGPQLYRCGNKTTVVIYDCRSWASMGPQLYRCGNEAPKNMHADRAKASMGPQLYRCGNPRSSTASRPSICPLQWGRNFIVAETTEPKQRDNSQEDASMGPQLYRCGNAAGRNPDGRAEGGFNGAATLSLRKPADRPAVLARIPGLQWGRNFIVAETAVASKPMTPIWGLQWGRNFIVAETRPRCRPSTSTCCFNGAATLSLRKHGGRSQEPA